MPNLNALDQMLAVLRTPERAAEFASQPVVWREIKRLAEVHRFTAQLAYSSSAWLPPSERAWRDQTLMTHHRRHAQRLAALRRLVEAFAEESIECVSLKGPLLAERLYNPAFLRPAKDLDLLVRENDIGRAARLMLKLGFVLMGSDPWRIQRFASHHLGFRDGRALEVEVHYAIRAGRNRLDPARYIERSVTWRAGAGFEARILSPADEAFHSCLHAASHAFRRLRWIYDFLWITRGLTAEERTIVHRMVREHGEAGPFAAATVALRLFFAESPALDWGDFAIPWLWCPLGERHIRAMVERVEGGGNLRMTSRLLEKFTGRLDMGRLAGNPMKAAQVAAYFIGRMLLVRAYGFQRTSKPNALLTSLPD
ncbi:MAG TPA: nucleotidyltransferase family protein [Bryobacteraceae bacterium]|nr:nucleotidyltransferase family protein [Bryobacteraceae bacterium]